MSGPTSPFARVSANFGLLLGGKAGAGVVSLVSLLIVAPLLGARDFGVLVLVHGYVVLVGGVVAFSGWHGVVRYGAAALEAGDGDRLSRLTRFCALVELGFGALAIVAAALLAPLVGPRLGWDGRVTAIAVPYSLALLGGVRATPGGLVQLARRFDWLAWHNGVQPLVRLAGAVGVWWGGGGLPELLWVWFAAALAEFASLWALGGLALRRLEARRPEPSTASPIGGWIGPVGGVPTANPGLLAFLASTNVDLTLRELAPRLLPLTVGWVLGPVATGVFALASRVANALQVPASLIGQASYSVMVELLAAGERAAFRRTVWRAFGWPTLAALPLLAVVVAMPGRLIGWLGGDSFVGGADVLMLVAAAGVARLGAPALSNGLTALGRPGRSVTVNLVVSLGLYPPLVPMLWWLGVDGAGWHALGTAVLGTAALAWWMNSAERGMEGA